MKNIKTALFSALIVGAASIAVAASVTFKFSQTTGDDYVNVWDVVSSSSPYGAFDDNNPYTIWCDNLTFNANSNLVKLKVTGNLSDGYIMPDPTKVSAVTYNFNGTDVLFTGSSATLYANVGGTGRGAVKVYNGATLTVENGATVGGINTGSSFVETLYLNEKTAGTVIVKGGSTWSDRNTRIGKVDATGVQKFQIIGSDNVVNFRNFNFIGATGTSAENTLGGVLEWVADANGITTIVNESSVQVFSGVVSIDFTNLLWDDSWGDNHTFTLLQSNNTGSEAALSSWVASQDTLANVTGAGDWLFTSDKTSLYITISQVPEPATYAAIFGALALALAAYRRRK